MRYALLGSTVLAGFALCVYACGSDDPAPAATASSSSSSSGKSSGDTSSSSSSSSSGESSTSSSTSSSGNPGDGGSSSSSTSSGSTGGVVPADAGTVVQNSSGGVTIIDAGGAIPPDSGKSDGSAGSLCQANTIQESEDNGTAGTTDVIEGKTGSFCGQIASPTDVDFVQFKLPANAGNLRIQQVQTGNAVNLELTVAGDPAVYPLSGADAGSFPFKPDALYTIKVTSNVKSDYIIAIDITALPPSSKCLAASVKESEVNDALAQANSFPGETGSFCGSISTTGDVDKFKFTMPQDSKGLKFKFESGRNGFGLKLDVEGHPQVDLAAGGTITLPFEKGKDYVFTATSTQAGNDYRVEIEIPK